VEAFEVMEESSANEILTGAFDSSKQKTRPKDPEVLES